MVQNLSDNGQVGIGIIPTHCFCQENPSFFDHFRRRSEKAIYQHINLHPYLLLQNTVAFPETPFLY